MIWNLILKLVDVEPNLCSAQYDPYPMFIILENVITADLNYGVAKVENALWPYPSCCAPKMHQLARPRFSSTEF